MSIIPDPYKKSLPSPAEIKARVKCHLREELKEQTHSLLQKIRDRLENGPWENAEGSVLLFIPEKDRRTLEVATQLLEEEGDWEITILSEGEGTTEIRVSPRSRRRGGIY